MVDFGLSRRLTTPTPIDPGAHLNTFRIFIAVLFLAIVIYTVVVIANHGLGLFPIFFGDIAKMTWPGQFNFDFLGFLLMSGLWMAWRNQFSGPGLLLGVLAVFGGIPLLSAYLFWLSFRVDGFAELMLGEARVAALIGRDG